MGAVGSGAAEILKELYAAAARTTSNEAARKLMRIRGMALEDGREPPPGDLDIKPAASTELFTVLSAEGPMPGGPLPSWDRVEEVSDPGERELLRALLALRNNDNSTVGRTQALSALNAGIAASPGDQRLRVLAEILLEADEGGR